MSTQDKRPSENFEVSENQANVPNLVTSTPVVPADVVPLDYQKALATFSDEDRQEIINLSNAIDVRETEKVMQFGSIPLRETFEQAGEFLKEERGSTADQEVIKQVIALSKKANESYEDFNLVLKDPNLFQKFLISVFAIGKTSRTEKIQQSAVTNYKLLVELKVSCEKWLEMLQKAYGDIGFSAKSDMDNIALLEKYIIAGKLAEKRIDSEALAIQQKYQETGLQQFNYDYQVVKEGLDLFRVQLSNLEKSRIMYYLSVGQLALIRSSNRDVQIAIHTQMENSLALMSQQIRNAVLDAKTREVYEAQKSITRLNDELIKDVSSRVGITAEDARKLVYAGFYNVDAAKEAVSTVIKSCEAIRKTAEEYLPKMKADSSELNDLVKQLESCVNQLAPIQGDQDASPVPNDSKPAMPQNGTSKLTF